MIIVTGATGFVGREVVASAVRQGLAVRAASRRAPDAGVAGATFVRAPELDARSDWRRTLEGAAVVVHTAARVHVMKDRAVEPLAEYRRANVAGTAAIATQAAAVGVRRFVFISSIKVNGERTVAGRPFHASDHVAPTDPYGISKREAECALFAIQAKTGMEVVVIRPVLVYGPGVKANFATMMRWVRRGVPLPFGAVHNARSLVALPNLVDLVLTCVRHPAAAGETFLVSDGDDLSTTQLLRRLAGALDVRSRLVPVPAVALRLAARLAGAEDLACRLLDSLQVDIEPTRKVLSWTPPMSVEDALRTTASAYLGRMQSSR